jgi:hypothetical protein
LGPGYVRRAEMLWGLADRFVDEVIELYPSREQAERALRAVLDDEPEWEGMIEVVPMALRHHWRPRVPIVRYVPRCRRSF